MYEFIRGKLVAIYEEYIVLENNGIGYRIYTSSNSIYDLELGKEDIQMFTEFIVREDANLIYGFTTEEELQMFNLLLKVSRIGPKVALGVLSTLQPGEIKKAIKIEDIATLCEAPGIGKKTAERLILELKDKIDDIEVLDLKEAPMVNLDRKKEREAIEALVSLGYSTYEIEGILKEIDTSELEVEDIIRLALKKLAI